MNVPGVREETALRYKVNGSAAMTDPSSVRVSGDIRRRSVSPLLSFVRDSSATVASGASRIPFERSSRNRPFPWRCCSSLMVEEVMADRKRGCTAGTGTSRLEGRHSRTWDGVMSEVDHLGHIEFVLKQPDEKRHYLPLADFNEQIERAYSRSGVHSSHSLRAPDPAKRRNALTDDGLLTVSR
jgi:hypothetical protein